MPLKVRLFAVLVFGLFLCSCTSRRSILSPQAVKKLSVNSRESALDYVRQQEAKLDIPLPLALEPLPDHCMPNAQSPDCVMLGFESTATVQDLILFYKRNMEGWRLKEHFIGLEHLLIYERPGRRACGISIRPSTDSHGTELVIFVGKKETLG